MQITQKLELDLGRRGIPPRIDAVQGDSYGRVLELRLYEEGVSWPLPAGASVLMRYVKPDGTGGLYDTLPDGSKAWEAEGNTIRFRLAPQVLTVPGMVQAQMEVKLGGAALASFTFLIGVEPDPSGGVEESEAYSDWSAWLNQSMANLIVVGDTQPESGLVLWFNTGF